MKTVITKHLNIWHHEYLQVKKVLSDADVKNDLLTENYKISGILAQFSHTSAFNSVMGVKH